MHPHIVAVAAYAGKYQHGQPKPVYNQFAAISDTQVWRYHSASVTHDWLNLPPFEKWGSRMVGHW